MISSLREQVLTINRQQRIQNVYLYLWNESLAMQIKFDDLIKQVQEIDKNLLEDKD